MNTVTIPASSTTTTENVSVKVRPRHPVLKTTAVSGLLGAVVVAGAAAIAHGAGVPFKIDGQRIPVLGFAQMTLLGAVLGGVIASVLNRRSSHPRRRFLQTTLVLTVASCLPSAHCSALTMNRIPDSNHVRSPLRHLTCTLYWRVKLAPLPGMVPVMGMRQLVTLPS